MKEIAVYTDGACSGNPGPGGWAAILIYQTVEKELSGFEANTTNNRMEITGVVRALQALNQPCKVNVYTDSAYVCNAFLQHWLDRWQTNGWMTSSKKPVENRDLWEALLKLTQTHQVIFHKVKGHADNPYNNRCDKLAVNAYKLADTKTKQS